MARLLLLPEGRLILSLDIDARFPTSRHTESKALSLFSPVALSVNLFTSPENRVVEGDVALKFTDDCELVGLLLFDQALEVVLSVWAPIVWAAPTLVPGPLPDPPMLLLDPRL